MGARDRTEDDRDGPGRDDGTTTTREPGLVIKEMQKKARHVYWLNPSRVPTGTPVTRSWGSTASTPTVCSRRAICVSSSVSSRTSPDPNRNWRRRSWARSRIASVGSCHRNPGVTTHHAVLLGRMARGWTWLAQSCDGGAPSTASTRRVGRASRASGGRCAHLRAGRRLAGRSGAGGLSAPSLDNCAVR